MVDATLSIEREPYWRALPPGSSSKRFYYEKNNLAWNIDNGSLTSGNDHWAVDTVENEETWNSARTVESAKNYIEVSNIPGDAPALMSLELTANSTAGYNFTKIYAQRSTKNTPLTIRSLSSVIGIRRFNLLTAVDAISDSADSPRVNDAGAPTYSQSGTRQRREVTFTTTTANALRASFGQNQNFNFTTFRGKWAVLARMRQVNGALGDITVQLIFRTSSGSNNALVTLSANPIVTGTTGDSIGWPLVYFGDVTLPIVGTQIANSGSYGEAVQDETSGMLEIWASRSTGTGVVYIADIVLLPFDEGSFSIEATKFNDGVTSYHTIVDNTGYLNRGTLNPVAQVFQGSHFGASDLAQIKGDVFTLFPGLTNRIYLLHIGTVGGVVLDRSPTSASETITARVNIVPRWRGVRDA